ncbi:MAG: hypothetical protein IJ774_14645 [Selenomonadaceae bacterium]|nr:hypothetical protein [Selenomonadaceae bacterium]
MTLTTPRIGRIRAHADQSDTRQRNLGRNNLPVAACDDRLYVDMYHRHCSKIAPTAYTLLKTLDRITFAAKRLRLSTTSIAKISSLLKWPRRLSATASSNSTNLRRQNF